MLELNYYIKYLRFLFSATNQHGVHSPFVYAFITRCLYMPTPHKGNSCERLILKMIPYFGIERVKTCTPDVGPRVLIAKTYPDIAFDNPPYDLIYTEAGNDPTRQPEDLDREQVHENSIIVIRGIHKNRQAATRWEGLLQSGRFAVSIDLFHCGILFSRTGQAAQHFKIRI